MRSVLKAGVRWIDSHEDGTKQYGGLFDGFITIDYAVAMSYLRKRDGHDTLW